MSGEEIAPVDTQMITEWGVQFEEPARPTITSPVQPVVTRTMPVPSEEAARKAVTWEHPPWDRKQNKRVVRREVTEWAEAR